MFRAEVDKKRATENHTPNSASTKKQALLSSQVGKRYNTEKILYVDFQLSSNSPHRLQGKTEKNKTPQQRP